MINKKLRKELANLEPQLILFDNPSFDNSIIGLDYDNEHIIYDFNKMVKELMKDDNMEQEDAIDFIEFNTIRALRWLGEEFTPIIIEIPGWLEDYQNKGRTK